MVALLSSVLAACMAGGSIYIKMEGEEIEESEEGRDERREREEQNQLLCVGYRYSAVWC